MNQQDMARILYWHQWHDVEEWVGALNNLLAMTPAEIDAMCNEYTDRPAKENPRQGG